MEPSNYLHQPIGLIAPRIETLNTLLEKKGGVSNPDNQPLVEFISKGNSIIEEFKELANHGEKINSMHFTDTQKSIDLISENFKMSEKVFKKSGEWILLFREYRN